MLMIAIAVPAIGVDIDKERQPPSSPIPLDFPSYVLPEPAENASEATLDDFYRLLISIRKPQDLSVDHLKALNLKLQTDVPASSLVPEDRMRSLPPLPWEDVSSQQSEQGASENSQKVMSNGNPYPPKEKFDIVKKEMLFDNDDAFREVTRMGPRPGRERIRVTQSRRFWTGLERMAQYWDDSLDNYFERPATPKQDEGAGDKMQTDDDQSPEKTHGADSKMDIDSEGPGPDTQGKQEDEGRQSTKTMYTGRRHGNGSEMPEEMREETIRGFVEMAAWPFGCQATIPSLPPRLAVRNLLFPVRQTLLAARAPTDRQLARKGVLEGPMLVVQCRPDISFREPGQDVGYGAGEVCDLFREVGAMLLAAQERAREGATEVKPGEGKWWTTMPRWGGAPNAGVTGDANNSDDKPAPENKPETGNANKRSKHDHPFNFRRTSSSSSSHPRKMSTTERWKLIQPGPSLWDKKMIYMQIGKPKDSPFDDVRNLSILRFCVLALETDLGIFPRFTCSLVLTPMFRSSTLGSIVITLRTSKQETGISPKKTLLESHGTCFSFAGRDGMTSSRPVTAWKHSKDSGAYSTT